MTTHAYRVSLAWTGNSGEGTKTYRSYGREYVIASEAKPDLLGSSDPAFRGDPSRYNPEELLVASLSSCHMLWYLHLCAANGITVVEYTDEPRGTLQLNNDGSGELTAVELSPQVKIANGCDRTRAESLHQAAHKHCFIARSIRFPVKIKPNVTAGN